MLAGDESGTVPQAARGSTTRFTTFAAQYPVWLAINADSVNRRSRVARQVTPTAASEPTRLPNCIGTQTTGHAAPGRRFTAANARASSSETWSVVATITQLVASSAPPPTTAATGPACTWRSWVHGGIGGDANRRVDRRASLPGRDGGAPDHSPEPLDRVSPSSYDAPTLLPASLNFVSS